MVDLSAIAKWPNVPACYEWLSLDRRGDWRLQGERVSHRGLIDFMNRQYGVDERGAWFVQNGPQRVFVDLAATPWVFRRQGDEFFAHTGQPVGEIRQLFIDESGAKTNLTRLYGRAPPAGLRRSALLPLGDDHDDCRRRPRGPQAPGV